MEHKQRDALAKNTEDSAGEYLITNQGVRINDNQNSLQHHHSERELAS